MDTIDVGGARRDRTDDLLLAKQALSQLSYGPFRIYRLRPLGQPSRRSRPQRRPSHPPNLWALVGLERFELSTSRLSSARSNQLSYRPKIWPDKRGGCPSEERETKAAVSRKWSQRLAPHLAPDVSKRRERPQPRWLGVMLPGISPGPHGSSLEYGIGSSDRSREMPAGHRRLRFSFFVWTSAAFTGPVAQLVRARA